jgi:hypothetical protein
MHQSLLRSLLVLTACALPLAAQERPVRVGGSPAPASPGAAPAAKGATAEGAIKIVADTVMRSTDVVKIKGKDVRARIGVGVDAHRLHRPQAAQDR